MQDPHRRISPGCGTEMPRSCSTTALRDSRNLLSPFCAHTAAGRNTCVSCVDGADMSCQCNNAVVTFAGSGIKQVQLSVCKSQGKQLLIVFLLQLNQRARFYERDVDAVADFPGAGIGGAGQVQLADVHQAVLAGQELGDHAKLLHLYHLCVPGQNSMRQKSAARAADGHLPYGAWQRGKWRMACFAEGLNAEPTTHTCPTMPKMA